MTRELLNGIKLFFGPGNDRPITRYAATRRRFLDAFTAKHQIVPDGEDQAVLIVGDEQWPFPVRLVRLNNTARPLGTESRVGEADISRGLAIGCDL
jgi:Protein of unknown function (DUF2950)